MKVAVIGGGNAGFAFAGHLSLLGHEVNLYEDPAFKEAIDPISRNKTIRVKETFSGDAKLAQVGTDMSATVKGVKIIIFAVPAFGQEIMFRSYMPYIEEGQVAVFFPGNYAALRFHKILKDNGMEGKILLAEADSIPYATRKTAPDEISIYGIKEFLFLATLPASKTEDAIRLWNDNLFEMFRPAPDVMYSSLNNTNCVMHCPTSVLNAGWIETKKGDFSFYGEGMSPSVCKVLEDMDNEVGNLSELFGKRTYTQKEFLMEYYGIADYGTLYETIQASPAHTVSKGPDALTRRYLSEDVPFGLVPISTMSRMFGLETPLADAVITLAGALNGVDYYEIGITPEKLGISGMCADEILAMIR